MRDEAEIFMESDMSLKSCSTRKRKKIRSVDDEKGNNKKRKQQPTHEKKTYLDKLFDLRFGRFLSHKKKNKTKSYFHDDPRYLECMKRENQARQFKGKTLNLSDLLFTKHRDFLITYNDRNRPVYIILFTINFSLIQGILH